MPLQGLTYFDRLNEKNGGDQTTDQGNKPFLCFRISKFDASDNDEEHRNSGYH